VEEINLGAILSAVSLIQVSRRLFEAHVRLR